VRSLRNLMRLPAELDRRRHIPVEFNRGLWREESRNPILRPDDLSEVNLEASGETTKRLGKGCEFSWFTAFI
jgi:hypothetical protein